MQNMSLDDALANNEGNNQNGTDPSQGDGTGTEMVPPQHLFSDYVEIAYLGLVICAGLALNISVLKRLLLERRRARRGNKVMSTFLLLKLNLNVSDILLLLIHASGKLGWLITYEWRGGDFLCRLFNLLSMFTLYLSSNIVICIALDRLFTVLTAQQMGLGQQKLNLVRLMLTLAWSFSLLFSLPQLFVWTTYNPFKDTMSRGWVQCTDIWSIDQYERQLSEQSVQHLANNETADANWATLVLQPFIQNSYELSHLFLVFYGPLIALVFCYVIISSRLIRFAANNPCTAAHTIKQPVSTSHDNLPPVPPTVTYTGAERRQLFKRSVARTVPTMRMYNSGKWRRKSQHYNQPNMLHHVPLMDILEQSSTKAEEPSNNGTCGGGGPTTGALNSTYPNQSATAAAMPPMSTNSGPISTGEEQRQLQSSSLMVNTSLGNSAISLPIALANCASAAAASAVRHSASSDQLRHNHGIAAAVAVPFPSSSLYNSGNNHCATMSPQSRNSISYCSSTISSSHDLRRIGGQPPTTERYKKLNKKKKQQQQQIRSGRTRKAQILSRIRDSFRESFGKRKLHSLSRLDDAELTISAQCLSTSSLFGNGAQQFDRDRRDTLPEGRLSTGFVCCSPFVHWMGWKRRQMKPPSARLFARNSTASSIGGRHAADILLDASSVPPTPHARPPSASTAHSFHFQQNGDISAIQSVPKSPWVSRNHSVRSSYSTTISAVIQQNGKSAGTDRPRPMPSSGHFLWRHRSRAFRTTLLVILVHILLWSPYNVYALMKHVNERLYRRMNEQANVLKDLQFLITLINPFLYGFGRSGGGGRTAVGQHQEPKKQKGWRSAAGGTEG